MRERERERERERLKFREPSLLFEVESSLRTTSSISGENRVGFEIKMPFLEVKNAQI